jgi:hypothetical protein
MASKYHTYLERTCKGCGKAFTCTQRTLERGGGEFCKQSCLYKTAPSIPVVCTKCGESWLAYTSRAKVCSTCQYAAVRVSTAKRTKENAKRKSGKTPKRRTAPFKNMMAGMVDEYRYDDYGVSMADLNPLG